MASFTLSSIKIAGISVCVPKNKIVNRENTEFSAEDMESFISTTGVAERRLSGEKTRTSDLSVVAAEKMLRDLKWKKSDIEILLFVSQSADYILPVTSALLQDRLGLSKDCIAFDVPLGCSGYVYGISALGSFMQAAGLKKGLLVAGDGTQGVSKLDKSAYPLFGDAASVTALELDENAPDMYFDMGTDGSGYRAIIIPTGGARNPLTEESLVMKEVGVGIVRSEKNLVLEGMDVFSFGITQAPKTVNKLLDHFKIDKNEIDYFIFHQANMMMNKMISKKLKLPNEKVFYSLPHFGNTSSASIPLTIVTELKEKLDKEGDHRFLLCGFGVGLSWATLYFKTSGIVCSNLIEYDGE